MADIAILTKEYWDSKGITSYTDKPMPKPPKKPKKGNGGY